MLEQCIHIISMTELVCLSNRFRTNRNWQVEAFPTFPAFPFFAWPCAYPPRFWEMLEMQGKNGRLWKCGNAGIPNPEICNRSGSNHGVSVFKAFPAFPTGNAIGIQHRHRSGGVDGSMRAMSRSKIAKIAPEGGEHFWGRFF